MIALKSMLSKVSKVSMILIAMALTIVAPSGLFAAATVNAIAKIDGESDKTVSIVTVALTGRPEWANPVVEDHGTFVQVLLPATIVPAPGTFLDANSPYITKIAAFQVPNATTGQPTDAAVRLFVNRDAAAVKQALISEILADRVVVTLDHKKLEAALASSGQISTPAAINGDIENVNTMTPAELVKADNAKPGVINNLEEANPPQASWPGVGSKVPNLSAKLAIVSGFSLFMLVLLGIVYKWKQINPFSEKFRSSNSNHVRELFKKSRKHRVPGSEDGDDFARDIAALTMKTISTMHVAPRQKLALVQVGTQTVLLSISPNGIQFLTNVAGANASAAVGGGSQNHQNAFAQISSVQGMQHLPAATGRNFEDRLDLEELGETPSPGARMSVESPKIPTQKNPIRAPSRQGATIAATTAATTAAPTATPPAASTSSAGSSAGSSAVAKRVRVAITDNGISDLSSNQSASKPSDDITRLIREKLRNLPVI